MFVILVFVVGNFATSTALSGVNLDCTNDYVKMSCHFDALNCTDYNVTLLSPYGLGEKYCLPLQCTSRQCCCSIHVTLVLDTIHTAFVRSGGKYVESKNISVTHSLKPQTPNIVSINETNGNFLILWKTNENMAFIRNDLSTRLTYRKKGDSEEVTKVVEAPQMEQQRCYTCFSTEIPGAHLEPSTTYVFTVQSLLPCLSVCRPPSEWSKEYEFTTPASHESLLLILFISLCLLAITITSVTYICYVKCRTKYWDSFGNYQNSKILNLHPGKEEVLKPIPPIISSIYVETLTPDILKPWSKDSLMDSTESLLQSSGIGTGLNSLSYGCTDAVDIIAGVQGALSKALMNIVPVSQSEQHSGLENRITYSFIRPSCPVQIMTDTLMPKTQPEMLCDSGYQETGGKSTCDDKRRSASEENMSPTLVSSYTLTTRSHQQDNRDSGSFASGKNSDVSFSCSNIRLSGDVEHSVETGQKNCQKILNGVHCKGEDLTKEGEGHHCIPVRLQGTIPSDGNYQALQSLGVFSNTKFEVQKSGNIQHQEKFLEKSSEGPTTDVTCVPAGSDGWLSVAESYEKIKGLVLLSDNQFRQQNNNEDLVKISLADASKGNTAIRAMLNPTYSVNNYQEVHCLREHSDNKMKQSQIGEKENLGKDVGNPFGVHVKLLGSLPMDNNYQAFGGLNELSVSRFEEQKSGNQYQDKVSENSLKSTSKVDSCVPSSSNHSFLVDDNYQAFPGSLKNPCHQLGEQNGPNKEDVVKVLENSLESAAKEDTWVPASSNCSLLVADGYETFQASRELSDSQFEEQKSGNQYQDKVLENSLKSTSKVDSCVPSSSNHSFLVDDNFQALPGSLKNSSNQLGEQNSPNKEDVVKVLENSLESATKENTWVPASSNCSHLVADGYEAFQGSRELSVSQFEEQKSGNQYQDKVLENSLKSTGEVDSCVPSSSNHSFLFDNNYKAFPGSLKNSCNQLGEQNSPNKEDVVKVLENSLEIATKEDTRIPASSNCSLLVANGYEAFHGSRELSVSQFEEQKSGNQYQDKVLENSLKSTSEVDSCVPSSSNHNFLVDDNYQAFPGSLKNSSNQLGEQNSPNKEDVVKVLENSLESVTKEDTWVPASSNCRLLVADGYEAFQGLRELSDCPFGQQNNGNKDLETPLKDAHKSDVQESSNLSFSVDDNNSLSWFLRAV
ncbi:uncharacterized protein LOC130926024 [Corythoichthys intestinalis]|uniref:uncharacterized protein LOC130926024 n=1 Tax=Corythoichthys intestinalis TaxID=161448 RepID=UPI0025A4D0A8|nr:uncharacterized protein LOC130926024 [Corythoichthys intestinalis]